MAFSTQKEFFHVPFMNETYEFECQEACVKLKSYPSTVDDRSWAADEDKKSRFVADLVACNMIGVRGGRGGSPVSPGAPFGRPGDAGPGGLVVGDSLINAAGATIGNLQDLLVQNNVLERRLADSHDRLATAKDENAEIKRIMSKRYDPEKSKVLRNKIRELANDNKIDPRDEQELNQLQEAVEDMNKAFEILQAENAHLKRLIEKQSRRCKMESLKIDPEQSNDIQYLQNKVNDLGKELAFLRQAEDELLRMNPSGPYSPDLDANDIRKIVAERDALRKKCKALKALEGKVNDLQGKAMEADYLSHDLSENLNHQNAMINDMQNEMEDMQKYYENEVEQSKFNEEVLKCRCDQLKEELMNSKCAAQRAECLQMEVDVLRNELRKRDVALNAYDCQYQQLMHKAKMFKNAGYRFLDVLPESGSDSCFSGAEEEEGGECTC
ncbi:keratin, type II cytoskeletal 2 oral isoform X2 [Scaptodrosophila lebanonensis]|uniref:Keratin, type II cytoskeletal 2 oral isoform X2 n=1 Tax=Drosophila lebanonensis TaxID=7225 RepID=A0A6J2T105_DROLE|nr:keratin, type II cytoskeletal 2 oral isoform X2 [Scaptodrosophila lebanonensis]